MLCIPPFLYIGRSIKGDRTFAGLKHLLLRQNLMEDLSPIAHMASASGSTSAAIHAMAYSDICPNHNAVVQVCWS